MSNCDTVEVKPFQHIEIGQEWTLKNGNLYQKYHIDILIIRYKSNVIRYGFIDGHLFIQDSLKENTFRRLYKIRK